MFVVYLIFFVQLFSARVAAHAAVAIVYVHKYALALDNFIFMRGVIERVVPRDGERKVFFGINFKFIIAVKNRRLSRVHVRAAFLRFTIIDVRVVNRRIVLRNLRKKFFIFITLFRAPSEVGKVPKPVV